MEERPLHNQVVEILVGMEVVEILAGLKLQLEILHVEYNFEMHEFERIYQDLLVLVAFFLIPVNFVHLISPSENMPNNNNNSKQIDKNQEMLKQLIQKYQMPSLTSQEYRLFLKTLFAFGFSNFPI
jgi:hypothetical protein